MDNKTYESLNDADKELIIETTIEFLDKYTTGEPYLCKLSALYASINKLRHQSGKSNVDPKEVFEVMYKKFGNGLFSQYTGRIFFQTKPSKAHLAKTVKSSLYPVAHYFTESPSLWEYGVNMFGIEANTIDFNGNNVLVSAAKVEKYDTVDYILRSAPNHEVCWELLSNKDSKGNTILHFVISECIHRQIEGHRKVAEVILSYLDKEEKGILLNTKNKYDTSPLEILTCYADEKPENKELVLAMKNLLISESVGAVQNIK